jgi:hypothetical protein
MQPPEIGRLFVIPLTAHVPHDRMRLNRARSSMVEQWPFKPLVAGSSPAALIRKCPQVGFLLFKMGLPYLQACNLTKVSLQFTR